MQGENSESTRYRWRSISVEHVDEIRNDVESLRNSLDNEFYEESLAKLSYEVPREIPNAKFIVIASTPQPAVVINFSWKGGNVSAIIPPTYAKWREVNRSVQKMLEKTIEPTPFRLVMAFPPLKTLAARSGLASYGRCNLSFVPGIGSYHRLVAFFTDHPDLEDQWQEKRVLPRCGDCGACIDACPTRAILRDRFLIKAERCLTNLNEMPSQRPFPGWVEDGWHNCIVGCMRCQRACPENKGKLVWLEDQMDFSEEETKYLLKGEFEGEEAKQIEDKLKKVGLDLSLVPRNLRALLNVDRVEDQRIMLAT